MPPTPPVSHAGAFPSVDHAFAAEGPLARALPRFRPREGQEAMARAVAQAIARRERLVVEAGTGVGKTFAYLVPALLSGEKVLVSTATKALQDQLYTHDLPLLLQALALPLRAALLKGRSSYLCRHRLEHARQDGGVLAPAALRELARIEAWAQATRTGDLAELPELDEHSRVVALVTSTRDNCLGQGCTRFPQCHVAKARQEALAADVVVLNHHLFFADLAVRESGMAELLPDAGVVVFDEAHRLADTALQFLGTQLRTGQLLDFSHDLAAAGQRWAGGMAPWPWLGETLRLAVRRWCHTAAGQAGAWGGADVPPRRVGWARLAPEGVSPQAWSAALQDMVAVLRQALAALDAVASLSPVLARLHGRAVLLLEALAVFDGEGTRDAVRWMEAGTQLLLGAFPLGVAPALQALWQGPAADAGAWDEDEPERAQGGRAWIFTSATLGDDPELRWFTQACGLEGARTLRIDGPFDYARQAALYVPMHLPLPADPAHSERLAQWVAQAVRRLGGRTLVLTTSLRALEAVAGVLREEFPPESGVDVLAQGQAPKRQLLARFRRAQQGAGPGCVLVGAASFWEGVDIPGEALQLVVIDKLPFPAPGDPWVEARVEQLEQGGRNAFRDHALPAAAVALKQGAGRLVRHETDAGVLVVADRRLMTQGYGKRLMRALPPMAVLATEEAFETALDALREDKGFTSLLGP
ncbi:Rad3-related DNA helicases [Acidovorax sp. MR-S7]|nr:ATP-dependent DNA helicase [Acidovorax sp. MR-S7]GAD24019.1 Rad3-related DNA helicases [Acidovorax sp. MR-S7]